MIKQHTVIIHRSEGLETDLNAIKQISLDVVSSKQLEELDILVEQGWTVLSSHIVYLDHFIFVLYHLYKPRRGEGRVIRG